MVRALGQWLFSLCVTATAAVVLLGMIERLSPSEPALPATADGFTVVIDAGHGGPDGGAVGTGTGVQEAGLNLAVARLVKAALEEQGLLVYITRDDENAIASAKKADMNARLQLFESVGADAVVSVHMNKFTDPAVSGPMVYYMQGSEAGEAFAQCVINRMTDALARERRGANPGDYFIVRRSSCPAIIVECGFLSNPEDEKLLMDAGHQSLLANAIAAGITDFLAMPGKTG